MSAPDLVVVMYVGAIGLIGIGIAGLVLSDHLLRVLLGLVIAEAGANLLLVLAGYRPQAVAPIVTGGSLPMVDPVPQALVLTAIVIGVGVQALAIALVVRVHARVGTLSMRALRERLERGIDREAGLGPAASADAPRRDDLVRDP